MKKVSGSFTGEMLCTEMIEQISSIKVLQSKNAVDGIKNSNTCKGNSKPEYELKKLHMKLKVRIIYTSLSFMMKKENDKFISTNPCFYSVELSFLSQEHHRNY